MPAPPADRVGVAQISTSMDRASVMQAASPERRLAPASLDQVKPGDRPVPDGPPWVPSQGPAAPDTPDATLLYDEPPPPDSVDLALRLLAEGRTDGSEIAAAIAARRLSRIVRPSR
jgi:hypothetical protein